MKDNRVVYGGGAAEIACSLAVEEAAVKVRASTFQDPYSMTDDGIESWT